MTADGATESGKGEGVKNVQFPHRALRCFKHSTVAGSPPGARGGHITFNLWKSRGSELYGRRRAAQMSHTQQKSLSSPRHFPVSTVYFSTVAPGLPSGDSTFDSSAQLQVAHHRGLIVCELFCCPSSAVFGRKPQGKEKCWHRRMVTGWSCSTHHLIVVLVVTSLCHSPQFEFH